MLIGSESPQQARAAGRLIFARRLLVISWLAWGVGLVPYIALLSYADGCGREVGCEKEWMDAPVYVVTMAYALLPLAAQLLAGCVAFMAYWNLPEDPAWRRTGKLVIAVSLLIPAMALFGWLTQGL